MSDRISVEVRRRAKRYCRTVSRQYAPCHPAFSLGGITRFTRYNLKTILRSISRMIQRSGGVHPHMKAVYTRYRAPYAEGAHVRNGSTAKRAKAKAVRRKRPASKWVRKRHPMAIGVTWRVPTQSSPRRGFRPCVVIRSDWEQCERKIRQKNSWVNRGAGVPAQW
jgi:hypothetical protein